jgi:hypothetical protein
LNPSDPVFGDEAIDAFFVGVLAAQNLFDGIAAHGMDSGDV